METMIKIVNAVDLTIRKSWSQSLPVECAVTQNEFLYKRTRIFAMTATKYQKGTKIAYVQHHSGKLVEDEIWLVRQGYYHMPSDDYLHDENIVGAVIDGKRVANDLFSHERTKIVERAKREQALADQWVAGTIEVRDYTK
jgi:hypothetical protein